jgi:hypothetical protein
MNRAGFLNSVACFSKVLHLLPMKILKQASLYALSIRHSRNERNHPADERLNPYPFDQAGWLLPNQSLVDCMKEMSKRHNCSRSRLPLFKIDFIKNVC